MFPPDRAPQAAVGLLQVLAQSPVPAPAELFPQALPSVPAKPFPQVLPSVPAEAPLLEAAWVSQLVSQFPEQESPESLLQFLKFQWQFPASVVHSLHLLPVSGYQQPALSLRSSGQQAFSMFSP